MMLFVRLMTFLTAGIRAGRACSAFCKAGFVLLIFPTTLHCHNFHIYLSPEFQTAEHDTDLSQTRAACSMRLPVQSFLSVNVNEWAHDCHFSIRAYLADKHFCFPDVPTVTKVASAMLMRYYALFRIRIRVDSSLSSFSLLMNTIRLYNLRKTMETAFTYYYREMELPRLATTGTTKPSEDFSWGFLSSSLSLLCSRVALSSHVSTLVCASLSGVP